MRKSKIYEENGTRYYFSWQKFKNSFDSARKNERLSTDEMRERLSEETDVKDDSIRNHLRSADDKAATNPKKIETVKKYGEYLADDEYAFLTEISEEEVKERKKYDDLHVASVKKIFEMLYDIFSLYDASNCYNYIPDTDDADGAWKYFEGKISEVRKTLETEFLGERSSMVYEKLNRIIEETEMFMKSYSVPGVEKRWREINPQINYFDCVFEIIETCGISTAYQLYRNGNLSYFPNSYDLRARQEYFHAVRERVNRDNLQYSENRIFQNELLLTLTMVFANDFKFECEEDDE